MPYEELASGKGIPVQRPIYEVVFASEGAELLFALSAYEYEVLAQGMKGTLVYVQKKYCNELISFHDDQLGEIIQEV